MRSIIFVCASITFFAVVMISALNNVKPELPALLNLQHARTCCFFTCVVWFEAIHHRRCSRGCTNTAPQKDAVHCA